MLNKTLSPSPKEGLFYNRDKDYTPILWKINIGYCFAVISALYKKYNNLGKTIMSSISLSASMRSNLLSLQTISKQVDSTQNKLSTGKKVNSAIDNPSSYYTARSLTNRASDLDALPHGIK